MSSREQDSLKDDAGEEYRVDEKGRRRYARNEQVAGHLVNLHALLVISGYPEDHAARYPQLAAMISRHDESVSVMHREGRLAELSGVGATIREYIAQFLENGVSEKYREAARSAPESVLELLLVPRLGAKTAKTLYSQHGIASLSDLVAARRAGKLDGIKGMGPKMLEAIDHAAAENGLG